MIYEIEFSALPHVTKAYTVTRRTVWQVTDPDNILLYIMEGACTVEADEEVYNLSAGDMFFVPQGQKYVRRPVGDEFCTIFYIHFSCGAVRPLSVSEALEETSEKKRQLHESFIEGSGESAGYTLYVSSHMKGGSSSEELYGLCRSILQNHMKTHLESALRSALYLSELLAAGSRFTLNSLGNMNVERFRVPPNLRRAISYIRANYTQNITLADLCRASAVSGQQLIRYFKDGLNTTPIRYINEVKINRAKELFLTHPELSSVEIASELGFSDPHYFSRLFKKLSGETPSHFKKRVHNFDAQKQ